MRLQAQTRGAHRESFPPQLCLYRSVALQFTGGGGHALLQLCQTGGMDRLVGRLLGAAGSLPGGQGGAPGSGPGARLLRWGAFQHTQFAGGFGLCGRLGRRRL